MGSKFRLEPPGGGEQQTHTWVVVEDLVICFTKAGIISDLVWDAFVDDVASPKIKAVLGLSYESVNINSVQRKAISGAIKGKVAVGAVLDSALTRGIVTAISWAGINIKAFSWQQVDAAVEYAAHGKTPVASALRAIEELLQYSKAPSLKVIAQR